MRRRLRKCRSVRNRCLAHNALQPSMGEVRPACIKALLGKTGESVVIQLPFQCDYGYNIEVGGALCTNHGCVILSGARVGFGGHIFIVPDCGFCTAGHPIDVERRSHGLEYAWPITVADNVWIGGAQVMPGIAIGSGPASAWATSQRKIFRTTVWLPAIRAGSAPDHGKENQPELCRTTSVIIR